MKTIINASLPVIIEIIEKIGWGRYKMRFGTREVSTKSALTLQIGAHYFANIGSQNGGVIAINSLVKRVAPDLFLADGKEVLNALIAGEISDWGQFLKLRLSNETSLDEFAALADMALAWGDGALHLAWHKNSKTNLIQIKQNQIYALVGTMPPLLALVQNGQIAHIASPYLAVATAVAGELGCAYSLRDAAPLWSRGRGLLDRTL